MNRICEEIEPFPILSILCIPVNCRSVSAAAPLVSLQVMRYA
jgi:hypothetical protein